MARHFKSNSWEPRVSGSSGAVLHGRTDEALTRTSLVPIPVLVVGFKSSGIAVTGARKPAPQIVVPASPPPAEAVPSGGEPQAKTEASPPPAAPETESEEAPAKERRTPASSQGDSIELIIDKLP